MNEMPKNLSLFSQSVRKGLIMICLLAALLPSQGNASPANLLPAYSSAGPMQTPVAGDTNFYQIPFTPMVRTLVGAQQPTKVTTVSAASYVGEVASGSIATAFGVNLASSTASALALPLPTELAGTTVKITDSTGFERAVPLFFVSPGQINYLIPPFTSRGLAVVTVINNGAEVARGFILIADVAPGVFAANGNGQGVAAAVLLRIRAGGTRVYEPVARFDETQRRFVAVPIDLGPASDDVFLILFGTGFVPLYAFIEVRATVGGTDAGKVDTAPQGDFAGLDQINVHLPRSLIGRGEVDVSVALVGKAANTVTVNFQ